MDSVEATEIVGWYRVDGNVMRLAFGETPPTDDDWQSFTYTLTDALQPVELNLKLPADDGPPLDEVVTREPAGTWKWQCWHCDKWNGGYGSADDALNSAFAHASYAHPDVT